MNEKSNKTFKIQKGVTFSDHDHFKKMMRESFKAKYKKHEGWLQTFG